MTPVVTVIADHDSGAGGHETAADTGAAVGEGGGDPLVEATESAEPTRLRLLSYNIQVGIRSSTFRDYLTGSWQHVLPSRQRHGTLTAIADQMRGYDIVAVQETDSGSLRSGFINQTEFLADAAGYGWWADRTNRRFGRVAQHSIGALARTAPDDVEPLRLPGLVPGRGALMLRYGQGDAMLAVVVVHLALARAARREQLDFIADRIADAPHAVVMGDFNAPHSAPEMKRFFRRTGLVEPTERLNTWPAWRPARNFDHILVSPDLDVGDLLVLDDSHSDHLPVSLELTLPPAAGRLIVPG